MNILLQAVKFFNSKITPLIGKRHKRLSLVKQFFEAISQGKNLLVKEAIAI